MENLKPDVKQVTLAEKKPVAYMLVLSLTLLGLVSYKYIQSQDARPADCLQFNQILLKRVDVLEHQVDELRDEKKELIHNTDSVVRTTIGEKAKSLLKKSKQHHEN